MSSIVEKNGKCWLCSHNYFFKGQFYHFVATLYLNAENTDTVCAKAAVTLYCV